MAFKFTEQEKKSLGITASLFAILFLVLIFVKFSQNTDLVDLEGGGGGGGVTINFGDSEVGSGSDYKSEVLDVSSKTKQQASESAPEDEIVSSDLDDAPTVVNTKPVVKKEPRKEDAKPEPAKPKPSKATNDALDNLLKGNNKGGDGDDGQAGNKGKLGGDKNSNGYYGDGGSGGGTGGGTGSGNGTGTGPGSGSGSGGGTGGGRGTGVGDYDLGGRKPLSRPAPKYTCNEEGKVVIAITVDRNGKVVKAERARGTTNPAQCLFDQARQAAMNTKFESSSSAPEQQVGKIIYNFKLTE
jgi:outer membrane biosynthesis protein TonB